jgi:hypothetical protein
MEPARQIAEVFEDELDVLSRDLDRDPLQPRFL